MTTKTQKQEIAQLQQTIQANTARLLELTGVAPTQSVSVATNSPPPKFNLPAAPSVIPPAPFVGAPKLPPAPMAQMAKPQLPAPPAPRVPTFAAPAPVSAKPPVAPSVAVAAEEPAKGKRGRKSKVEMIANGVASLNAALAVWQNGKQKDPTPVVNACNEIKESVRTESWTEFLNSIEPKAQKKLKGQLGLG